MRFHLLRSNILLRTPVSFQYTLLEVAQRATVVADERRVTHVWEQYFWLGTFGSTSIWKKKTNNKQLFYNNCLICRALIGAFLSSIGVEKDRILILCNFQLSNVTFLTSEILWTFWRSQSKSEKSCWHCSRHFEWNSLSYLRRVYVVFSAHLFLAFDHFGVLLFSSYATFSCQMSTF